MNSLIHLFGREEGMRPVVFPNMLAEAIAMTLPGVGGSHHQPLRNQLQNLTQDQAHA